MQDDGTVELDSHTAAQRQTPEHPGHNGPLEQICTITLIPDTATAKWTLIRSLFGHESYPIPGKTIRGLSRLLKIEDEDDVSQFSGRSATGTAFYGAEATCVEYLSSLLSRPVRRITHYDAVASDGRSATGTAFYGAEATCVEYPSSLLSRPVRRITHYSTKNEDDVSQFSGRSATGTAFYGAEATCVEYPSSLLSRPVRHITHYGAVVSE
ncbi:hypothetical protein J6590_022779 [Homalodisca vitripennis]|nr:hypothetical protein J6590_022779 [Homalodisca vitripennis]